MATIDQHMHQSKDTLHISNYAVTPCNSKWVVTYCLGNEFHYSGVRDTQQEAVNLALISLDLGDLTFINPRCDLQNFS